MLYGLLDIGAFGDVDLLALVSWGSSAIAIAIVTAPALLVVAVAARISPWPGHRRRPVVQT